MMAPGDNKRQDDKPDTSAVRSDLQFKRLPHGIQKPCCLVGAQWSLSRDVELGAGGQMRRQIRSAGSFLGPSRASRLSTAEPNAVSVMMASKLDE
jgi:hypothetical protein